MGWPTASPALAGPAIAAVVVTAWISGRAGLADLARRIVRWRFALRWWAATLSPLAFLGIGFRDVMGRMEQDGWQLEKRKGSQCHYHHPTRPGYMTVAGKPSATLHPRASESVLSQAGLCGAAPT